MTKQVKDLVETTDLISGTTTLWGMPVCDNLDELTADVALVGVPWDLSEPFNRANTRRTPKAMREARHLFRYYDAVLGTSANGWFDVDTNRWMLKGVTMADCGNVNVRPDMNNEGNHHRITSIMRKILDRGALPLSIGGDHSTSIPLISGFDRYDPLDIVYFDAHFDFLDKKGGSNMYNACPMRRCSELPFVRNITSIGLRQPLNPSNKEMYDAAVKYGVNLITADKFRKIGASKVIDSIPQAKNLYVSIDIDGLDPSEGPGQSYPEPGGLTFLEMRDTLIGIAQKGKVVGVDLVCLSPDHDCSQTTVHAAANMLLYLLSYAFPQSSATGK
ncbi:arginase family protein [Chloroflexota bacterium]